jgi:hypothetical protein
MLVMVILLLAGVTKIDHNDPIFKVNNLKVTQEVLVDYADKRGVAPLYF